MKRFLSTMLVVCILFSMATSAGITVNAYEPENNPPPEDDSIFAEDYDDSYPTGIAWDMLFDNDNGPADMVSSSDGGPADMSSGYGCIHAETEVECIDADCDKYNSKKHKWITTYEEVCCYCGDVLDKYEEVEKEYHDFEKGKCRDCGYKAKDCEHEETKEVISFWDFDDDGGEYVEYEVICKYCDVVVDTKVHNTQKPTIQKCTHDETNEFIVSESYANSTNEKHTKWATYQVECLECEEELNSYTEESEEKHVIANGKCTKCTFEEPKPVVKPSTNQTSTSKEQTTNKVPSSTNNTSTTTTNKTPTTATTTNKTPTTSNANITSSKNEVTSKVIDTFNIYVGGKNYYINNQTIATWKSMPEEINGKLQVPLREFAETMGWKVTWDDKKKIVYVEDGVNTKTFIPDCRAVFVESGGEEVVAIQTNDCRIVNGNFYADLDGLVENTKYSYYGISGNYYIVTDRQKVIEKVSSGQAKGKNEYIAPESLYADVEYQKTYAEKLYVVESDGSYYATVIVPAAQQGLYGNYYEGNVTKEGLVCRILVGELPGAGTVADLRDVAADFQNWEWSWSHAGDTLLDIVGIVPVIGAVKFLPEIADAAKTAKKLDAVDSIGEIKIIANLADSADDAADVAKGADKIVDATKNADEVSDTVKDADKIADTTKTYPELADAARASIKSIDDLKKLVKDPSIWTDDLLEHIFYGNKAGGYHYAGLKGANGYITEVTKAPNKYGVYEADVFVCGKKRAKKTFFPDGWTPQQVIDTVEDAFKNGTYDANNNTKLFTMDSGLKIQVNLDTSGKIVSVFPLYK